LESNKKLNKSGGRNELSLRIATGVPAFAVVFGLIAFARWEMLAIVLLVTILFGLFEYHGLLSLIVDDANAIKSKTILLLGGVAVGSGAVFWGASGMSAALVLMVFIAVIQGFGPRMVDQPHRIDTQKALNARIVVAGLTVFGWIWIPWFFGHTILLIQRPEGPHLLFWLIFVIVASDTLAFFSGKMFGRHKLHPSVSPGKTIEGSIGGVLGGMAGGYLAVHWLEVANGQLELWFILVVSAILAIVGQVGDLTESLIKRGAGVKDSGRFLPGHGGFLDRLDALLLPPPFLYYFLEWYL